MPAGHFLQESVALASMVIMPFSLLHWVRRALLLSSSFRKAECKPAELMANQKQACGLRCRRRALLY